MLLLLLLLLLMFWFGKSWSFNCLQASEKFGARIRCRNHFACPGLSLWLVFFHEPFQHHPGAVIVHVAGVDV
jgi:hypothetical protein